MKKSVRRFLKIVPLFISFITYVNATYQTYDVEGQCRAGSLKISLDGTGDLSAGILKATNKISYSLQMDCWITIEAPPKHYIMVSIRQIGFRAELLGKCIDYIQINGQHDCKPIYNEDEAMHYQSTDNRMKLHYHTSRGGLDNKTLSGYPGFTLTFTAFQKVYDEGKPCSARNASDVFLCEKEICIWSGLTCDGHNNCGDLSDEDPYGNSHCGVPERGSTVLIVLGLLIVFLLIIMCVATLLCTKNESIRRFSTRLRSRTVSFIPRPSPRRSSFKQISPS